MRISPFLAIAALSTSSLFADKHDSNGNIWLNYAGDHPIVGSKWGVHLEGQVRRSDLGEDWQQVLVRPGVNYQLTPSTMLSMGYAHVETYPYGDFPALHEFPEHRFWQQVSHTKKWMGLDWTHRFRLEQRWIGEMQNNGGGDWDVGNWRFENRFRYMLRTTIPLTESKKTYLALSNEVFFNFGGNIKGNDFDQNRAFIGIGHKLNDTTRVELGFMEQTIQRRGGKIWEHNNTAVLWLLSNHAF
jgi:Protein of unknown function (DUF2490)